MFNRKAVISLALILGLIGVGDARAATLDLDFEPPALAVSAVCVSRAADADLIARWSAWDGKTLPQGDSGMVTRDLRRLAEMDATGWNDTIQRAITVLHKVSPSYTEDHAMLARIEQMMAMGQLQELRASGLVKALLDRGDANSPRTMAALSDYLRDGIGIDRDKARSDQLLMAAAYGGNADALLSLSHMAVDGTAPAEWDISPDLAVTMAFGSLVGQIDPLICDRIARIAREYSSGELVTANNDLAMRWYRFAADLGDPIAAWRVAEYQMQSELITKDNDVLLTYLNRAAEGGLPYAQVVMGRAYEVGALLPKDLAKAQEWYEKAAATHDRAAQVRLASFLEEQSATRPELRPEYLSLLERLAALPDMPGSIYAKQAQQILAQQGRWKGEAAARPLLEQGAALDDVIAIETLAQIEMRQVATQAQFYTVVDQLIHAVDTLGEAGPTADLQDAFMCKTPVAPMPEDAAYWRDTEAAIGTSSTQFTDAALQKLESAPSPMDIAALQTQALYGRATPLANLQDLLTKWGAAPSTQAFWGNYAKRLPNLATAKATLALTFAKTAEARAAALDQFRAAAAAGETPAAMKLAVALLEAPTEADRHEALTLLLPLAKSGNGDAMLLLPQADAVQFPDVQKVYASFADTIAERGDFSAVLLAMPFLHDAATLQEYHGRAISAMACGFPQAVAFAQVSETLGQTSEAERWLHIAGLLAEKDPWQLVQLGDSYGTLLGATKQDLAQASYERAYDLGSRTAVQRLLRRYGQRGGVGYNADRTVQLYLDLVARSDAAQIPDLLNDINRREPIVRNAVLAKLDLDAIYKGAAESGNPAAMREHSRRLRDHAVTQADITLSTDWLIKAAEKGDAPAMVMLAQAYSIGVGVPASVPKAREWLQKAADAGDPTAAEMVKLMTVEGAGN